MYLGFPPKPPAAHSYQWVSTPGCSSVATGSRATQVSRRKVAKRVCNLEETPRPPLLTLDSLRFSKGSRGVPVVVSLVFLCLVLLQFRLILLLVLRLSLAQLRLSGASHATALLALLRCVGSILIRVTLHGVGLG